MRFFTAPSPALQKIFVGGVIAGIAALYLFPINSLLQDFGDSSQYLLLAKAIAFGEGYRTINYPGAPVHTDYPPLFPFLLSPIVRIFGFNLIAAKCAGAISALGAIFAFWLFARSRMSLGLALASSVYLALSPQFLLFSQKIMSEPLFSLLLLLALREACKAEPNPWKAGLLCAGAFLTRKIGIALGPAILLGWAISPEHRKKWLALSVPFCVASLLPTGLWVAREHLVAAPPSYGQLAAEGPGRTPGIWLSRIRTQGYFYSGIISQMTLPQIAEWFAPIRALALFPISALLVGLARFRKLKFEPVVIFLALYAAILLVWPWNTYRFWVPVIPLFVFALAMAAARLPGLWPVGVLTCLTLFQLPRTVALAREIQNGEQRLPEYSADYIRGTEQLKGQIPPTAILMAPEERMTSLLTGNQAISYWYDVQNPESLRSLLKTWGVSYVVYDGGYLVVQRQRPVPSPAALLPECMTLETRSGSFELFRVSPACQKN